MQVYKNDSNILLFLFIIMCCLLCCFIAIGLGYYFYSKEKKILISTSIPTRTSTPTFTPSSDTISVKWKNSPIKNNNDKCLDVISDNIVLNTCNNTDTQNWKYDTSDDPTSFTHPILHIASGKCLNKEVGSSTSNKVILSTCNPTHKWLYTNIAEGMKNKIIHNDTSCLDYDGTSVITSTCNDINSQKWYFNT
jgi:hypothetical protein